MLVGSFGEDIIFEVSIEKVFTLSDFHRKSKANFSEHKIIGRPAILEFLGRDLEQITFSAIFSKELLGDVDLLQEVHKFREKLWSGEAEFFILNSHLYTENKMVIEDLSEEVKFFSASGEHIFSVINVTLKEYVEALDGDS